MAPVVAVPATDGTPPETPAGAARTLPRPETFPHPTALDAERPVAFPEQLAAAYYHNACEFWQAKARAGQDIERARAFEANYVTRRR